MPLGDDQKAMLRLLAGGQSYEDIAALMGLSVDEVATKAKGAVAQLEAEGIPAPSLPDAPGGAAPKPAEPPAETPPAPVEKAPEPQPAPEPAKEPAAKASPPSSPSSTAAKPGDTNKLLAIGAGVAAIAIVVLLVLLLTGGDDDKGDPTTASAGDTTSAEVTNANGEEPEPTMAVLKAVDGQNGSGTAVFGNLNESLVLAIEAQGLEPTAKGERYAICIANGPDKILPIASTAVGANGTIKASVELPDELLLFLVNETYSEIVVTRADNARLTAEIKRQPKQPKYTGTPVLQGDITGDLIGNEELLKEVQEAREAEEAEAGK